MEDQDLETRLGLAYLQGASEAVQKSIEAERQRVDNRHAAYEARRQEVFKCYAPKKPFLLKINVARIFLGLLLLLMVGVGLIIRC